MNHIIRLNEQDTDLLTRAQGEKIRARIEELLDGLPAGDRVVVDLSDVQVMTPSFADECLGKLAERLGAAKFREAIRLTGADETNRTLVNAVLSERLSAAGT